MARCVLMTWTYTNNPSNSTRDLIRILVNDIDTSSQLLTDEFIAYALTNKGNTYLAASLCAETLVSSKTATTAYLASNVTRKKVGDLELSYAGGGQGGGSAADHYRGLAKSLRLQAAAKVTPYSGGISVDDKDNQRDDADWDRPFAEIGMHDGVEPDSDTGWH